MSREEPMINVQDIHFRYDPEQPSYAVDGVSLAIHRGEFVAVLGANGCGKSTLAKHFNAILLPEAGTVLVEGMDTRNEDHLYDVRQKVGMVFQPKGGAAMTRIAIVEDEAAVREQLTGYVQRYTRQYGTPFEVSAFASGVEILEEYRPVYDIIFLDVEMPHLDGMETARRIRALDSDVLLIFITNMAQYAIKGYAVGALDYVLKPVPYFAFSQQLQKAVNQLTRRVRHYLAVPVDGGMRRLDAAGIYYIESEGHRIHFYTEDGDFSAPGALKALEEKLAAQPFARCNSGYLVNLAQVSGVQQSVVQVGPYELQISRPKRKSFLAALADFIGGEG